MTSVSQNRSHDPRTRAERGRIPAVLILAAEDTNTDLIVIGTHGRGRLARMFIGSTAELRVP